MREAREKRARTPPRGGGGVKFKPSQAKKKKGGYKPKKYGASLGMAYNSPMRTQVRARHSGICRPTGRPHNVIYTWCVGAHNMRTNYNHGYYDIVARARSLKWSSAIIWQRSAPQATARRQIQVRCRNG